MRQSRPLALPINAKPFSLGTRRQASHMAKQSCGRTDAPQIAAANSLQSFHLCVQKPASFLIRIFLVQKWSGYWCTAMYLFHQTLHLAPLTLGLSGTSRKARRLLPMLQMQAAPCCSISPLCNGAQNSVRCLVFQCMPYLQLFPPVAAQE